MKNILTLSVFSMLTFTAAYAQEARDYGILLPDQRFAITHERTDFKDRKDVPNFVFKSVPKGDVITYKVDGVNTPMNKEYRLSVEREAGRLSRITTVSFAPGQEPKAGIHTVQSVALISSGHVGSKTNCYDSYSLGFFGNKLDKKGFSCVTVNRKVCDYLEQNKVDDALLQKVNACSDVMKQFAEHQKQLDVLSKEDHKANISALSELSGRLSSPRNFYELEASTLSDIAGIVTGYGSALSQCAFLVEKDLLAPAEEALVPGKTSLKKRIKDKFRKKGKLPAEESEASEE